MKINLIKEPHITYLIKTQIAVISVNGNEIEVFKYTKQDEYFSNYEDELSFDEDQLKELTDEERNELEDFIASLEW